MVKGIIRLSAATLLYSGFAVYLYQPHFKNFDRLQYALVISVTLAAIGCYILSRRWIVSFFGSFFAGAIYGFGPFMLGLARFHPAVSVLAGGIPWLFLPAAYGPKGNLRWLRVVLSLLPFIIILAFFQAADYLRFFPASPNVRINVIDLASLLSPLVAARRGLVLIGFYHIPIVCLIIGFGMLIKARRVGTLIIIVLSLTLTFCNAFLSVNPVIWFAISAVCLSVIAGVGVDGLSVAGTADRRWILISMFAGLCLAVVTLLLASKYFQIFAGLGAGYARLFVDSAKMYILGAVTVCVIFFITRASLRLTTFRLFLLCCALGLDIFLGAQYIVDRVI